MNKHSQGFSLVELLIVIAIIAILAAILLPALNRAMLRGDIIRAQKEMAEIASAAKNFFGEYSRWPCGENGQADVVFHRGNDQHLVIGALRGLESESSWNPKRIPFLEVSADSIATNGCFLDPWDNPYVIVMDTDFDNKCTLSSIGNGSPSGELTARQVAVWSWGPKGENNGDEKSIIKTWE